MLGRRSHHEEEIMCRGVIAERLSAGFFAVRESQFL
jgi:hypothetical protein